LRQTTELKFKIDGQLTYTDNYLWRTSASDDDRACLSITRNVISALFNSRTRLTDWLSQRTNWVYT